MEESELNLFRRSPNCSRHPLLWSLMHEFREILFQEGMERLGAAPHREEIFRRFFSCFLSLEIRVDWSLKDGCKKMLGLLHDIGVSIAYPDFSVTQFLVVIRVPF